MMSYLEGKQLLHNWQPGFRSKGSCDSQLIELPSQLSEFSDQSKEVDAIVSDFSKAFDEVNYSKLIQKLLYSNHWSVTSGIPQGSQIGPSLYLT